MRPTTRMDRADVESFQQRLRAGMRQYRLKPADLADHPHLRGRAIQRFNDPRTVACLCKGAGVERKACVAKLYEHATAKAGTRSLSADWAYRVLCILHASKKVAIWREARDPGEDDWLWDMDHDRLNKPWGDPDPMALGEELPPIGIPHKYAAERFAREIARVLARTKNLVGVPWIKRVDERYVAELLRIFFDKNRLEMAASFASWFGSAASQYRVVFNESKREMTPLLIREGLKSKIVTVPSGGDPYEVRFTWSRDVPDDSRPLRPEDTVYAFLTHDLEREAREHEKSSREGR